MENCVIENIETAAQAGAPATKYTLVTFKELFRRNIRESKLISEMDDKHAQEIGFLRWFVCEKLYQETYMEARQSKDARPDLRFDCHEMLEDIDDYTIIQCGWLSRIYDEQQKVREIIDESPQRCAILDAVRLLGRDE